MNEVFEIVDRYFQEYKQVWIDLCNIESKSSDKAGVDKVGRYIKKLSQAKGFGIQEKTFNKAGNYIAVTMNTESSLPGIAFMAHMDTVHESGKFGDPPVKEKNGRLYGPGVADCKGGIAAALLVMNVLQKTGYKKRPIKLVLSGDEEVSNSLSGQAGINFIRNQVRGYAGVFNCETGMPGKITLGRKGILRLEVEIKGKAAHSGVNYFRGVSAIKEAAHKIIELEKKSQENATTYNCGIINGGKAGNIVPDQCSFSLEIRYVNQEGLKTAENHVNKVVNHSYISGSCASLNEVSSRLPMEKTEGNVELFKVLEDICCRYGLEEMSEYYSGGGSDAAYTVDEGVPTVCSVGPVGEGNHTLDETAVIDSLASRAKMLTAAVLSPYFE